MDELYIDWTKDVPSQKVKNIKLNAIDVMTGNDITPPGNFPTDAPWNGTVSDRTIANGANVLVIIDFQDNLVPGSFTYTVKPTFDIGCFVQGSN
jgi:hypothetical protein